jgi:hypothetical protein
MRESISISLFFSRFLWEIPMRLYPSIIIEEIKNLPGYYITGVKELFILP